MKVVHVLRTAGVPYGAERTVTTIVSTLVKRGADVHVIGVVETRSGVTREIVTSLLRRCGCSFDLVETSSRLPFGLAKDLAQVFSREEPAIVHTHGYKCDLAVLLARPAAARITTVHGWCSRTKREKFYEWLGVQCEKRLDGVIALCENYRDRLARRGVPRERIHVAHVGIDAADVLSTRRDCRAEWGVRGDEALVVQVGRLSPEKNPLLFAKVASRLMERFPHVKFVLVGEGTLMRNLRPALPELKGRLILAGYIHEMGDVFRAADIMVNCSGTEGLPGALLEGGVMGVPAVATAVGGVPEIVEDGVTGILCPRGDADALAAGVARLVEDADLRAAMGAAARERIGAVFSNDACAERLLEVYEEVLARRHPQARLSASA